MIKIKCDAKDFLALDDLTDFQGNLKERNDADFEKIQKSIQKHGFSFPFFVWKKGKTNYVLDGHGRLGALNRMAADGEKIPPLPVVFVKCKDEAEAKEILLKLNSTYGHMTADSVKEFVGDLDIQFDELALPDGFIDLAAAFQDIDEDTQGDDDSPEVDEESEPDSKPGEMYELGGSILMCGDSTNEEDVARLMGGDKADLALTDPPYNVAYEGKTKDKLKIQNDKMEDNSFFNFLKDAFTAMFGALKAGGSFYIWHADSEGLNFRLAVKESGGQVRECLVWNKNSMVLGRQDYQWKHEPCLYGWKGGGGARLVWRKGSDNCFGI